jgi:hypothetical protein
MPRTPLNPDHLRVGDRIRIIGIPGEGIPGYWLHPDTRRVYKMLIARRQSVRIYQVDKYGTPCFRCCIRRTRAGRPMWDFLGIYAGENNWVPVKPRNKRRPSR